MRRIFLFIVIILCSCDVASAGEVFSTKLWGFSINKPDGWVDVGGEFAFENIKKFDFSEQELREILSEKKITIVFASSKRDLKTNSGIIPTIKIAAIPVSISDNEDFLNLLKESIKQTISVFDNPVIEQPPTEVKINGITFVLNVVSFDLPYHNETYRARTFVYSILRKGYFLQFNFADRGEKEDCSELFKELASSITFDKK